MGGFLLTQFLWKYGVMETRVVKQKLAEFNKTINKHSVEYQLDGVYLNWGSIWCQNGCSSELKVYSQNTEDRPKLAIIFLHPLLLFLFQFHDYYNPVSIWLGTKRLFAIIFTMYRSTQKTKAIINKQTLFRFQFYNSITIKLLLALVWQRTAFFYNVVFISYGI